jgi:hypothetical protein
MRVSYHRRRKWCTARRCRSRGHAGKQVGLDLLYSTLIVLYSAVRYSWDPLCSIAFTPPSPSLSHTLSHHLLLAAACRNEEEWRG